MKFTCNVLLGILVLGLVMAGGYVYSTSMTVRTPTSAVSKAEAVRTTSSGKTLTSNMVYCCQNAACHLVQKLACNTFYSQDEKACAARCK
jgi:uncharacterized protein (UPF0333 family)